MAPPEFDLEGQIALVTGAGRGLGLEIARMLAAAGAAVLINGRQAAPLHQAAEDIVSAGGAAAVI